jgi:hypothetical protein
MKKQCEIVLVHHNCLISNVLNAKTKVYATGLLFA